MSSSDMSIISKQFELMSMTDRVLRHNKRLLQESRYSPYTLGLVIFIIPFWRFIFLLVLESEKYQFVQDKREAET